MRLARCACLGAALLLAAAILPGRADDKAEALLKQTRDATQKLQSLKADIELSSGPRKYTGTVVLKRPNLARIELKDYAVSVIASDGKSFWQYQPARNEYLKATAHPQGLNVNALWAVQVRGFFSPASLGLVRPNTPIRHAGTEKVDGVDYEVVESALTTDAGATVTQRWFISPKDSLVHRYTQTVKQGEQESVMVSQLRNVQVNQEIADAFFAYTPPANATAYKPRDYAADLIPVGKEAPDFQLPVPGGAQRLALSDLIKGKKATLVNFWFYN